MQSQPLKQLPEHVAPLAPELRPQIAVRASDRPTAVKGDRFAGGKPSIGRRVLRSFARLCIGVSIGVSATLAWQLHGDKVENAVGAWLPPLNRLLPIFSPGQNPLSHSPPSAEASAVSSSEMATQLKTLENSIADAQRTLGQLTDVARDIADMRWNAEQLSAKQEQMAQSIATLQKFEQDVKQKLASAPRSRSVPLPPRKPPLPTVESSAVQTPSAPPTQPPTQQAPPSR
jgi:hypothetical protein